jgi:hypothetical protein
MNISNSNGTIPKTQQLEGATLHNKKQAYKPKELKVNQLKITEDMPTYLKLEVLNFISKSDHRSLLVGVDNPYENLKEATALILKIVSKEANNDNEMADLFRILKLRVKTAIADETTILKYPTSLGKTFDHFIKVFNDKIIELGEIKEKSEFSGKMRNFDRDYPGIYPTGSMMENMKFDCDGKEKMIALLDSARSVKPTSEIHHYHSACSAFRFI